MAKTVRFPQYLKKHGLFMIFNASEAHVPGLIVERRGGSFFKLDALDQLLDDPGLSWKTKLIKADLPDAILGRKKVAADGSINLPFIGIRGGLTKNTTVDFSIGAVHVREFTDNKLRLWNPLRRQLRKLKKGDPATWKDIKGHYLIISTWYASEYSVAFSRAWTGELDASFRREISLEIGANVSVDKSHKVVNVKGTKKIPFAFFGRRLRGIG
jgi:hypothetical protein